MQPAEVSDHTGIDVEELLVRREFEDESLSKELLNAFRAIDVDLTETERPLHDSVDTDALDRLFDHADRADNDVGLSTVVWGHPVLVTTDAIHIFGSPSTDET